MVHYCENVECGLPFYRLTQKEKYCHKCRRSGLAYYKPTPTVTKVCPVCKRKFETNNSRKIYCSAKCREEADTRGNKPIVKTCLVCSEQFKTTDTRRKYCSKECYKAAKAQRSKKNGTDSNKI